MDRDTVIALAKDAGLPTAWISDSGVLTWADLEHFATLAIAYEREECAKVCESEGERIDASWMSCAAAIRSRT